MDPWIQAALTLTGGVIGAGIIWGLQVWREHRRENNALIGAIRIVRYELTMNATLLSGFTTGGPLAAVGPSDASYRSVELTLARSLPLALRLQVAGAYMQLPVALHNIGSVRDRGYKGTDALTPIAMVADEMSKANRALGEHLTTQLRTDL
jgi:hypothetical protein